MPHEARGEALMFGGAYGSTQFEELWAWTGQDWVLRSTSGGPSPRRGMAMTYDSVRARTVVFGGVTGSLFSTATNETWEWDGSSWTQRNPVGPPAPRVNAMMGFDPGRGVSVLYGGRGASNLGLRDTWEWDGTHWQKLITSQPPPAMSGDSLVFDPSRQCIVLVGGVESIGPSAPTTTTIEQWEYDGTAWTFLHGSEPGYTGDHSTLWERDRQRRLLYDGYRIREWALTPAEAVAYGAGCGSPAPRLSATTRPRLGEPDFGCETQVASRSLVAFGFSHQQAAVPILGGCSLAIGDLASSSLALANGSGFARQPIVLPANITLRGLAVFAQVAALDPSLGALSLSTGLRILVGD